MQFDERELRFIRDREFLLTKNTIIRKVHDLLDQVRSNIRITLDNYTLASPQVTDFKSGKISRGENYRGLPYLVLDYPAIYNKKNIFAFRTMFWWGNFFSTSFHLQGKFLDLYRSNLIAQLQQLAEDQYYLCIGERPWEYHYEQDNYRLLSENDKALIEKQEFIKLSKKFELDQWEELPALASKFVSDTLLVLE